MSAHRISALLHEEHRATIAAMERLEGFIASHRRAAPAMPDGATTTVLRELAAVIEAETSRHFDFEEQQLFAVLADAGDAGISTHLADEHAAMRPLGARLAGLARTALAGGFGASSWEEFRRVGLDLAERMLAHVQKEEMALLPLLDDALDAEVEARLYEEYVAGA